MSLYLGIDIGTSGVRTSVIDATGNEISSGIAGNLLRKDFNKRTSVSLAVDST